MSGGCCFFLAFPRSKGHLTHSCRVVAADKISRFFAAHPGIPDCNKGKRMLKDYIFWGLFIAVVAGVIVSLLKRRRRGPDPRGPTHSNRMQFHAHTDADAHDSGTPRLVCIGGSHDGHTLAIPPGGLSIGRARDNLLIIVDGRISSHHAWIGMVDGRVMLRDYQSLNGTFLNADLKTRVGDAVLADGDIVHFGGVVGEEFRLVVA
jgi:hypothetical protein